MTNSNAPIGNQDAMNTLCPECGAPLAAGQTCRDHFDQMLFWESEDPSRWAAHHLMVLCYHLQHFSLYSAAGLAQARMLLADFLTRGRSPEEARRDNQALVNYGRREWTVTARPGDSGAYERPIAWTMTAADVVAGGAEAYVANVRRWSETVLASIAPDE